MWSLCRCDAFIWQSVVARRPEVAVRSTQSETSAAANEGLAPGSAPAKVVQRKSTSAGRPPLECTLSLPLLAPAVDCTLAPLSCPPAQPPQRPLAPSVALRHCVVAALLRSATDSPQPQTSATFTSQPAAPPPAATRPRPPSARPASASPRRRTCLRSPAAPPAPQLRRPEPAP